jgi:hypothetical protein
MSGKDAAAVGQDDVAELTVAMQRASASMLLLLLNARGARHVSNRLKAIFRALLRAVPCKSNQISVG